MKKIFYLIFVICVARLSPCEANVQDYDPDTGKYTIDRWGSPWRAPKSKNPKPNLPKVEIPKINLYTDGKDRKDPGTYDKMTVKEG